MVSLLSAMISSTFRVALQAMTALATVPTTPATIRISGLRFFRCRPTLFTVRLRVAVSPVFFMIVKPP